MNRTVRLVSTGGGMVLVATGAWGALAYSGVYAAESEFRALKASLTAQLQQQEEDRGAVDRTRDLANTLRLEQDQQKQAMAELDGSIDATATRLTELQSNRKLAAEELQQHRNLLNDAQSKLSLLQQQLTNRDTSIQGIRLKVDDAKAKNDEAWRTMNPLNSPLLKDFFERENGKQGPNGVVMSWSQPFNERGRLHSR